MKFFRFIVGLPAVIFLACLAHAESPWGVMTETAEDTTFSTYAVDNLIDKRPIRYAVSTEVTPQEEQIFKENILKWPAQTLQFIQESGRTKEFKDILPILQHKLVLQKVSEKDSPDVVLGFTDDLGGEALGNFVSKNEGTPFNKIGINNKYRAEFADTSLHEIGHYFGLADQYEKGRFQNSHTEYSSNVNFQDKAIMQGSSATDGKITCDDADGLINLIDLRLAQRSNGRFSARAQKRWKTLCPSSENVYQNALTINRSADAQILFNKDESWMSPISRQYTKGRLTRESHVILDSPLQILSVMPGDKVIRDPKTNRITAVTTLLKGTVDFSRQGEKTYDIVWKKEYSYQSPRQRDGQEVVPIQITEFVDGVKLQEHKVFISADGGLQNMRMKLDAKGLDVSTLTYEIAFLLQDRQIVKFGIFDKPLVIIGYPGEALYYSKDGGKNYTSYDVPISDDERAKLPEELLYYYEDVYKQHQSYLRSFYRDFYEPLFGQKAFVQEQVQSKIKNSLGAKR